MLTCGGGVFYRPKDKKVHADAAHAAFHRGDAGDHLALLRAFQAWQEHEYAAQWCHENFVQLREMKRARDVREQLVGLLQRVEIELVGGGGRGPEGREPAQVRTFLHPQQQHCLPIPALQGGRKECRAFRQLTDTIDSAQPGASLEDAVRKSVAAGYFCHAAQLQKGGHYRTAKHPQTVHLHPSSGLAQVRLSALPSPPRAPTQRLD